MIGAIDNGTLVGIFFVVVGTVIGDEVITTIGS
jgi:hypothetical protein